MALVISSSSALGSVTLVLLVITSLIEVRFGVVVFSEITLPTCGGNVRELEIKNVRHHHGV